MTQRAMHSPKFGALVGNVPSTRGELVLTEDSTGSVETVNTLSVMAPVIEWTVQRGSVLRLRPTDFVAALLRDVTPAELGNNTPWELVVRDPLGRKNEVITSGVYAQIRAFQDNTLKKFIGVSRDIGPDYVLAFRINSGTAIVVANCDFAISTEVEFASLD